MGDSGGTRSPGSPAQKKQTECQWRETREIVDRGAAAPADRRRCGQCDLIAELAHVSRQVDGDQANARGSSGGTGRCHLSICTGSDDGVW